MDEQEFKKLKYLINKLEPVKGSGNFDTEFKKKLYDEIQKAKRPVSIGAFRDFVLSPALNLQKAAVFVAAMFIVVLGWHFYYIQGLPVVISNGTHLKNGMAVQTKADSQLDIQLKNMYSVRLKPDSILIVKELKRNGNVVFELKQGKALVQIEDSYKPREFIINTPTATATALGTAFMVNVMPKTNEKTWLGVLSGRVEVSNSLAKVFVNAGEKTIVEKGRAPVSAQRLLDNEWRMLTEIYQIGQAQKVVLLIGVGPQRVKELLKPAVFVIYGKDPKTIPQALRGAVTDINDALKQNNINKHIEAIRKLESIVKDYPDPKRDPQLLLFIGAYYEYLSKHKEAIGTFEKVLTNYPDSTFASLALCAEAVIYKEGLQELAAANNAFTKIISKYPSSPEAEYAKAELSK